MEEGQAGDPVHRLVVGGALLAVDGGQVAQERRRGMPEPELPHHEVPGRVLGIGRHDIEEEIAGAGPLVQGNIEFEGRLAPLARQQQQGKLPPVRGGNVLGGNGVPAEQFRDGAHGKAPARPARPPARRVAADGKTHEAHAVALIERGERDQEAGTGPDVVP